MVLHLTQSESLPRRKKIPGLFITETTFYSNGLTTVSGEPVSQVHTTLITSRGTGSIQRQYFPKCQLVIR